MKGIVFSVTVIIIAAVLCGFAYAEGTWTTYTTDDGLANNAVIGVAIDHDNVKWFATYGGVSSFDGATWTTYTKTDGLADNSVYKVMVDSDNVKWFRDKIWGSVEL